jgi:trimethylamine---corrinoid protein Co-methyltransferase
MELNGMLELGGSSLHTPLYRRLTTTQLRALHDATLEILSRIGIRFPSQTALELFQGAGCEIVDGDRVHISASRVEWALERAPRQIILYNQMGEPAIRLSGRRAYFGPGSDLLNIIDHRTGEHRKPLLNDVIEAARLFETLPNFDFVMSYLLPADVPTSKVEAYQMRAMLEQCTKPIIHVNTDLAHTKTDVALAEALAGGADELRRRPFIANYINIASPLHHNPESIEKLIYLARKGLPAIYRPSIVTRGLSTPITVAGFLALNNASQLAGLVLSQLAREGAPFIRCSHGGGTFDMRTMVGQHAAPEARGFNADLAHYYGLPSFGIGGLTGSKTVDQQAALEAALTLLEATLAGEQLIHDVSYMNNGLTGSFEQAVICHEMIDWVKAYLPGLEITPETLALDVMAEIRDAGDFMAAGHTLKHYREDWYPQLLDRGDYQSWVDAGSLTLREKARAKVDETLAAFAPKRIPDHVRQAWDAIV